jgi:hypothetical protein
MTVERIGIETEFVIPKCRVEPFKQSGCLCTQLPRTIAFAERVKHLGHADPGAVNIALKLAQRLRSLHQRAVRIDYRVAGILPSHVLITDRRSMTRTTCGGSLKRLADGARPTHRIKIRVS